MTTLFGSATRQLVRVLVSLAVLAGSGPARAVDAVSAESGAAALLGRHVALKQRLADSPYRRPLVLESSESGDMVHGSVDAVLQSSFLSVSTTFKSPARWCDVLILHLNTKYCRAALEATGDRLKVHIGKKTAQRLSDAFALDFDFKVVSAAPDYLSVMLTSPNGPVGTTNYRMEVQAVPLSDTSTFFRLKYSYGFNAASRLAMRGYLATIGSGKVGFTQTAGNGENQFVGGMRGAVERNTMRYYLAVEAFQSALARPLPERLDSRLGHWFSATEEFPRQLREITKTDYLEMKKGEILRQESDTPRN